MLEDRLRHTIKEKGYSQKSFAKKINISPSSVNAWVQGTRRPDIDKLIIIATTLDVSTDYLLGLSDEINFKSSIPDIPNSDDDMLLQQIIDLYMQCSVANKYRIYADCLDYVEEQNGDNLNKKKRGQFITKQCSRNSQNPPAASAK